MKVEDECIQGGNKTPDAQPLQMAGHRFPFNEQLLKFLLVELGFLIICSDH